MRFGFLLLALLVAVSAAWATDAALAYVDNVCLPVPYVRFWNNTGNGSWGPQVNLSTSGSAIRYIRARQSVYGKNAVVTEGEDGYLNAYTCNTTCNNTSNWVASYGVGQVWNGSINAGAQRRFDMRFMATGELMLVYGIFNTSTTCDLAYKILPNASTNFSGINETCIDDALNSTDLNYTWVAMDRHPTNNSTVLAAYGAIVNNVSAWVWNGTNWTSQQKLNIVASAATESFAVAYAGDGSKALVVAGNGTVGDLIYQAWNGSAWSARTNITHITNGTDDVAWMTMDADPATDDIMAVAVSTNGSLGVAYWNGTAWASTNTSFDNSLDGAGASRPTDFTWNQTGSIGYLLWDTDAAGTAISVRNFTASTNTWSALGNISAYAGTGAWLSSARNPNTSSSAWSISARLNSNFDIGSFYKNSTNFSSYGDGVFTNNTALTTYESFYIVAYNGTGIAAYRNTICANNGTPFVKFWNSSGNGTWSAPIALNSSNTSIRAIRTRYSPLNNKLAVVTEVDDGFLNAYLCNSTCNNTSNWQYSQYVGQVWNRTALAGTQRRFDMRFETLANDLVLAYSILNTSTSCDLAFKVLPSNSTSFSGIAEQCIDDTINTSDVNYTWVTMSRNPLNDSMVMAAMLGTGVNRVNAWVWNGSNFTSQKMVANVTSSATESFGVEYESDGTGAIVVSGNGTTGDLFYALWNGSAWGATTNVTHIAAGTDDVSFITTDADPTNDDIMVVATLNTGALATAFWNGTGWANISSAIDTSIDNTGGTSRPADFSWAPTGNIGYLTWDTDAALWNLTYRVFNASTKNYTVVAWQNDSYFFGTGAWLSLARNPTITDAVDIIGTRMSTAFYEGGFYWNGTDFVNYGDTNISNYTNSVAYESYSFAFMNPSGLSCGTLGTANTIYNMTSNLTSAGTCFNVTAQNVTLNCNGYSITGDNSANSYGVYSNQFNTTVKNCTISNFQHGIYFNSATNGTMQNNSINITYNGGYAIYLSGATGNDILFNNAQSLYSHVIRLESGANNNNIVNNSATGYGSGVDTGHAISVFGPSGNLIENNTAVQTTCNSAAIRLDNGASSNVVNSNNCTCSIVIVGSDTNITGNTVYVDATSGAAIFPFQSTNIRISNNNITALGSNGKGIYNYQSTMTVANNNITFDSSKGILLESSLPSTVANNTFSGNSGFGLYFYTGTMTGMNFTNNTFETTASTIHVYVNAQSSGNTFWWNNFTDTSGYYVQDLNGNNFYNTSLAGQPAGNIWHNVWNESLNISGTVSSPFPNLYYGSSGSDYPYNSTTAAGKLSGNVVDWAPLTTQGPFVCKNLSIANKVYTMTSNLSSLGTCFNVTAANVTLNCSGYSITGDNTTNSFGVFSSQFNTTVQNCNISNFEVGILFNAATNGTIEGNNVSISFATINANKFASGIMLFNGSNSNVVDGNNASSNRGTGIMVYSSSSNNSITSSIGNSNGATYSGISVVAFANNNFIINSSATSNGASGFSTDLQSSNNSAINLTATSNTSYGAYLTTSGGAASPINIFANSTIISSGSTVLYINVPNGRYINNTIISSSGTANLLNLSTTAGNNTFYWNNFTNTSGLYVNDTNGSNIYNTSLSGQPAGNIWYNVINGTVPINGSVSAPFPGLYYGFQGTGYPYNNTTAGGKIAGNVTDRAPLTPTNNSSAGLSCGTLSTVNATYSLSSNLSSAGTCFNITAANITLNCSGFTITGSNASNSIGVKSIAYNTTIKNCIIQNFSEGIRYDAATDGLMQNNTITTTFSGGNGTHLASGAHRNILQQNTISSTNASGIAVDGGSNISIDCSGRSITGGNFTATYGVYSKQFNTTIKNCNISNFAIGIYFSTGSSNGTIQSTNASTTKTQVGDDGYGIYLLNSDYNTVTNSTANSSVGTGAYIYLSNYNTISGSAFICDLSAGYYGIYTSGGTNNSYSNSNFTATGAAGVYLRSSNEKFNNCKINGSSGTYGALLVFDSSQNNTIANSTVYAQSGSKGIVFDTGSNDNNQIINVSVASSGGSMSTGIDIHAGSNNTIDCRGKSIAGTNSSDTYGVYSTQFNTTIKNCIIQNFSEGIRYDAATDSLMQNNTINTTFLYGSGITVTNNAHRNSLTKNTIWCGDANGIYVDGGANTSIDCQGASITGGINATYTNQFNTTVKNCVMTGASLYGIQYSAATYGTVLNNTVSSASSPLFLNSYSNFNTITNNTITSTAGASGLYIRSGNNNTFLNITSTTGGWAFYLYNSSNNSIAGSVANATGISASAANIETKSYTNSISNSTLASANGYSLNIDSSSENGTFINNTFISPASSLVVLASTGNTFYWNNFTNTAGPYYFYDSSGGANYLNGTVGGAGEGNLWYNVLNGSVDVGGTVRSSGFPAYYLGSSGTGYPYNSTTSAGRVSSTAQDFAPLTQSFGCGPISSQGIYTLTKNQTAPSSCFTITSVNVTIDCNGYTITGPNLTKTYGVYSVASNTTVKNCTIRGFDNAVRYNGAADGLIQNNTLNTTFAGGSGIGLNGAAHRNTLNRNVITCRDANGIYNDGGQNASIDCQGASITGGNYSARYGIYSNQTNTTVAGCFVSNFSTAIYLNGSASSKVTNTTANATFSGGYGLYLAPGSNSCVINSSRINASNAAAIYVDTSSGATISSVNATSPGGYGIALSAANSTNMTGSFGNSTSSDGIFVDSSIGVNITNSNGTSESGNGIYVRGGSNNVRINGSIGTSKSVNGIEISGITNATLANSSGISNQGGGIKLTSTAGANLSNANGSSDSDTGIWLTASSGNTITNAVGRAASGTFAYGVSLEAGSNSNNLTNITGISNTTSGIVLNASTDNLFIGANGTNLVSGASGYGFYLLQNANNNLFTYLSASSAQSSGVYVEAGRNISIDCTGGSITGGNNSGSYGVYTSQANTTVKNCAISNFSEGIRYGAATDGLIQNNTITTTFFGGYSVRITSGADRNSMLGNAINNMNASGILVDGGANVSIDCAGARIVGGNFTSKYGTQTTQLNTTIKNCDITDFASGIFISGTNATVLNSTVYTPVGGYAAITVTGNGHSIRDTTASATTGLNSYSIDATTSNSVFRNVSGTGGYAFLILRSTSSNNTVAGCNMSATRADSGTTYATLMLQVGSGNTFANNTLNGSDKVFAFNCWGACSGNTIYNNTLLSTTKANVYMISTAGNNTFYWNNFSATSAAYVNDTNGSNFYNTTMSGHGEGNIWGNVLNGSVQVIGSNPSLYGSGLYFGTGGSGYPYNNTTAGGKIAGNVADYAPLTSALALPCGNLGNVNATYTMTSNLSNSSTCFTVTAANVTLDCNGYSITGNNTTSTYGVYSNKYNTTIKNCIIRHFNHDIFLNGATNGTLLNNTATEPTAYAIYLNNTNGTSLTGNYGNSTQYIGIYLYSSDRLTLRGNNGSTDSSQFTFGAGIWADRVSNSTFGNNRGASSSITRGIIISASPINIFENNTGYAKGDAMSAYVTNEAGIYVTSSNNSSFRNNTATADNGIGLYLLNSRGNNITNGNYTGSLHDFHISAYASECSNNVSNNTGSGGKPILYYYSSVANLANNSNISSLIFCNITSSTISNISADTIFIARSNSSNFTDIHATKNTGREHNLGAAHIAYALHVDTSTNLRLQNATSYSDSGGGLLAAFGNSNTFINVTGNTTWRQGAFLGDNDDNDTFINLTGISNSSWGIIAEAQLNNVLRGIYGYSNSAEGIVLSVSDNMTVSNATGKSNLSYGIWMNSNPNGRLANSTAISTSAVPFYMDSGSSNNSIYNNTLVSESSAARLLQIDSGAGNNTFWWNNFTATSGLYVNDTNGSNIYNTSLAGQPAGNIWYNVLNGSVSIQGTVLSPFSGLYYGSQGTGYPYNNTTAGGKIAGNVTDRAPLTTNNTVGLSCGTLSTVNATYSLSSNLSSAGTCFNITAANITLNCSGYTITGSNASASYGIYSNQFNTTIKNCVIQNFSEGIRYDAATDGLMQNNTITTTFSGGNGTHLASGAHRNILQQNTISSTNASGVAVDGGSNISIDCSGRSITGGNFSSTYGVYSNQYNTTIRNCAIGSFMHGVYFSTESNGTINNTNATSYLLNGYAFYLSGSAGNSISNINGTHSNAGVAGIGLYGDGAASNNIITNGYFWSDSANQYNPAFRIHTGTGNTMTNITAVGVSSTYGIFLDGGRNTVINSTGNSTSGYGILIEEINANLTGTIGSSASSSAIYQDAGKNTYIDCQGKSITGTNTISTYGIYSNQNNTTVKNCNITRFPYGIYLNLSSNSTLYNLNISNSTTTGVKLDNSNGTSVTLSRLCSNGLDLDNSGSLNSGEPNTCDSFYSWSENGHSGCTFACTSLWHRFFGNVSGKIILGNSSVSPYLFSWNTSNGLNVYFTDYDANVSWQSLRAIGMNTSNQSSANDFTELDSAFNTASFRDNINVTYSTNGSAPKATDNYTVYGKPINSVPIANSTYNTSFRTGVLWDSSAGGAEYSNVTKQPTVWVVKVNKSASDIYGNYDYLAQIPYTLSTYQTGNDLVAIYAELQ